MRHFPKRFFSLLLAWILVLCLVPAAFAEDGASDADSGEQVYAEHGLGRLPEHRHGTTQPLDAAGHSGLQTAGLPLEGLALVAGIDRVLDMFRTCLNITGDGAVTIVMDQEEKKYDSNVAGAEA
jgi:hypothetical protein